MARGVWFLLLLCQSVFCDNCVTYDFEHDFEEKFPSSGLCWNLPPWKKHQYSSMDIGSPHIRSTSFISPPVTAGCVSSFHFNISRGGILEVNVFMGENSAVGDSITAGVVQKISPGASETVVGWLFHSPALPDFVSGWRTLSLNLGILDFSEGYVFFRGMATSDSVVLIDSFRYFSRDYDGDCLIYSYKDPVTTTNEYPDLSTKPDWSQSTTTEHAWTESTTTAPDWTQSTTTDPDWTQSTTTESDWPQTTPTEPDWSQSTTTEHAWTESTTTDPNWTQSTTTEPDWTQSTATEPDWTQSTTIEPDWTQSSTAEPDWSQSTPTEPNWTQSTTTELDWSQSSPTDPDWTQSSTTEPDWSQSTPTEPDWPQSTTTEPDWTQSSTTEPGWSQSTPTEPDWTQSTTTELDWSQSSPTDPDWTQSSTTEPDWSQSTPTEPDWTQSSTTEPDWSQSTPTEPDWSQSTPTEPDWTQSTTTDLDWSQSSPTDPDWTQSSTTEPDWSQSTPTEPDWTQSSTTEPDWSQSTPTEPDWTQSTPTEPDWSQSTSAEPDWSQSTPTEPDWPQSTPTEPDWSQDTTTDSTWPSSTAPGDQDLYCTDCVTYNFEKNFDHLFIHNSGKCAEMSPWKLQRYTSVNVARPHNSSTTFVSSTVTRPVAPSCASSFAFQISNDGLLEVNVYMDASSQLLDYISVLVMSPQVNGSESVVGKLFHSPLVPNFVPGWTVLRLRIDAPSPFQGYITMTGMTTNSTLIVDSFRYIPPNCDEDQCVIYENALDTTTTWTTAETTTPSEDYSSNSWFTTYMPSTWHGLI